MENIIETMTTPQQIKSKMAALSSIDGLKRTQRWLAGQTGIGEVEFSNKINNNKFTQQDLDKINAVLETDFKIELGTE